MRRQILINFLLLYLFFLTAPRFSLSRIMALSKKAVHAKIEPAKTSIRSCSERVFPTWVERKTLYKHPSGPNPTGNHHPPAKP